MVKPSLKTTSFKQHPVYVQKALHVDGPFYGPKLQYQRAEIIPGGDCQAVTGIFHEQTDGQLDVALQINGGRSGVVGDHAIRLTQTVAACNRAVYLRIVDASSNRFSIDLSWTKYVGMWVRVETSKKFVPADLAFYIFTKEGNYLYANRAMHIPFFETEYTDAGSNVWRYIELELARFTRAAGYESDNLSEVWGIGWYSEAGTDGDHVDIDRIEFYTHGTTKGPARGLIESAPLLDDTHAERGYGLRWDVNSGRLDHSNVGDFAFAGICVGNPSRTRLSQDVTGGTDTILHVVDASLLRPGKVTINDDSVAMEAKTILAVDSRTITLETAPTGSFTVANNAYVCMEGNEEGTIRVDFIVDGVVNLEAAQAITRSYGCICAALGNAPLTVNQAARGENGLMIGKAVMAATADDEHFPVKLMTDSDVTPRGSAELFGKFFVNQGSADLLGKTNINHP